MAVTKGLTSEYQYVHYGVSLLVLDNCQLISSSARMEELPNLVLSPVLKTATIKQDEDSGEMRRRPWDWLATITYSHL